MPGHPVFLLPIIGAASLILLHGPCASAQAAQAGQQYDPGMVLHVESREVVIDVVARDRHNLPIADLAAGEFQVSQVSKHGRPIPLRILYIHTIDPGQKNIEENETSGFHVSTGAVCALDYTLHYQIAIAASSQPGYHTILVKIPGLTSG